MSRSLRIVSSLLIFALVMGGVAGIAWWTANSDSSGTSQGFYVNDKKVDSPQTMITIGTNQVPFSIYRHYFLTFKGYFQQYYGATFYDEDPDGDKAHSLKKMVEVELKNAYTWLAIAGEMGVSLNEEDLAKIETTLAEQKEAQGTAFAQQLQEMHYLDEENYREVSKLQALMAKAQTEYREKLDAENREKLADEVDKAFLAENLSAKHILIKIDDTAADRDAAKQAAKEKADGIFEEILASDEPIASFNEMMALHTEDPGLAENPDGYTFKEGEMVEIFYETTKALEENEISPPVLAESSNYSGYHIILRMPLTDAMIEENREAAISQKIDEMITEKQTAVSETFAVVYPDFYEQITVNSIK